MKYKSVKCFPLSVLSRQAQIENSSLLHFYLAKSAFKLLFSLYSFTILFIFLFFACTALLVKLLCILALH